MVPPPGHRLATNITMAHQAIVDEMTSMVAGLYGYRDNIRRWAEEMNGVDADSAGVTAGIKAAAACVGSSTFDAECTAPTQATEGGT